MVVERFRSTSKGYFVYSERTVHAVILPKRVESEIAENYQETDRGMITFQGNFREGFLDETAQREQC